jgi:hypothetical protein
MAHHLRILFRIAVLCAAIVIPVPASFLYSQTLPDGAGRFGQEIFRYHFDRADRETDPSLWLEQARRGRELALTSWERTFFELYHDPDMREAAAGELGRWSEEELERRFSEWLKKRFFAEGAAELTSSLALAVDQANRLYTYHTGNDGNIIYNAETGDPEVIRPAEGRDAGSDKILWRDFVSREGNAGFTAYKTALAARLPEILSYIPEEKRGEFQNRLSEIYTDVLGGRDAELRALLAREEQLFIARRTGDVWSLRRQNENENVSVITARLLKDAETACAAGIASLEARMEAARAGAGDLSLMGQDWLDEFREQFGRGLKAWEAAEERFLIRRMEWERDSGEYFLAGQEAWQNAFSRLEQERLLWENKSKELFDAGEKLFFNASLHLQNAIAEARAEFERDAQMRIYGGVERVESWADMYITCGSVLEEIRESVDFWLSRFVDREVPENALEKGTLESWVDNILKQDNVNANYQNNAGGPNNNKAIKKLTANQKMAGQELIRWSGLYVQYRDKAAEAKNALQRELSLALGQNSGALNSVLSADTEDFHLDEYQIELLRTQAVAAYWENRLAIAEAVSVYAADITAGRMTGAESLALWKEAKAGYDAALVSCTAAQDRLRSAGPLVESARSQAQQAAALLGEAERKLEELNAQYALQMAAYRVNTGDFILEELGAYYAALLELYDYKNTDVSFYMAYLTAARDYSAARSLAEGWMLLENIAALPDAEMRRVQLALLHAESAADWYFAVTGTGATPEARAALEAEGVLARLEREAETGGGQLPQIYRNLAPYSRAVQKDAAASAMKNISRIFADYGLETGGQIPAVHAAGGAIFEYSAENNITVEETAVELMIRIGKETELLPAWIGAELESWKQAVLSYLAAKALHAGTAPAGSAQAAAAWYEQISAMAEEEYLNGGNMEALAEEMAFCHYLYVYLSDYENMKNEILSSSDREHWRTYISSPFIDGYNLRRNGNAKLPGGVLEEPGSAAGFLGALSWEEGFLADTWEKAESEKRKLETALALFLAGSPGEEEKQFAEAAGRCLNDPDALPEYAGNDTVVNITAEFYLNETEKFRALSARELELRSEISRLGFGYGQLLPGGPEAAAQMEQISAELNALRRNFQQRLNEYKNAAAAFASAGNYYETLYAESKTRFDEMEKARAEYEKQDAVQRWAGTAYLYQKAQNTEVPVPELFYYKEPREELDYAREHYERAEIALAALRDLYDNGEKKRPYNSAEYAALYEEYQTSFTRMFLGFKAKHEVEKALASEKSRNAALYNELSAHALKFLNPELPAFFENYTGGAGAPGTWCNYLRIDEQGRMVISFDPATFKLNVIDAEEAAAFSDYFKNKSYTGDGESQMSPFEQALTGWTVRMNSYNLRNADTFQKWGLAFDYLVRNLAAHNPDIEGIKGSYTISDLRENGKMVLGWSTSLNAWLASYRKNNKNENLQQQAWNAIGEQGREDMQFLLALFLSGGMEQASGLTQVSELKELQWLYKQAGSYKIKIPLLFFELTLYLLPYTFDHSGLNAVFNVVESYRDAVNASINKSREYLSGGIKELADDLAAYRDSCETLKTLAGLKESGETTGWSDIENALNVLGIFSGGEIAAMENWWNEMLSCDESQGKTGGYASNAAALEKLMLWTRSMRAEAAENLENAYFTDELSSRQAQTEYRTALESYINGNTSLDELTHAAGRAYGNGAPVLKNHLENIGSTLLTDMTRAGREKSGYAGQYRELAAEYTALVQRSYQARFAAELSAREVEWAEKMKDLNEKILAWREASELILERGRSDWKAGEEFLREAYTRWTKGFEADYGRISAAWDAACLESLAGKEAWINRAMEAADKAYSGALLSFVGSDAEALSRSLDMFAPSMLPGHSGAEEAEALLSQVFDLAGITGLSRAFAAFSGSARTAAVMTGTGSSGAGLWNTQQVHAAAKEFAHKQTADLAAGKMAVLAARARETALAAKHALEKSIANANQKFDDSMDEVFILGGGWSHSGASYIRDVIVHSTFFESAITDRIVIESYRWYVMEAWDFVTDLSDASLEGLDYLGIEALIGLAQREVREKSAGIFGDGGLFSRWTGTYNAGEKSGEMGRLLTEYYKWASKQAQGIALMNVPIWDKPLWDSRGSWFSAPSLRGIADMGMMFVSALASPLTGGASLALSAAINLVDDAFFSGLDAVVGYKSWDEAGFAFGQKALLAAASSAAGSVFNGVAGTAQYSTGFFAGGGLNGYLKGVNNTLTGIIAGTAMPGIQSIATSTVTSALSAVTYDKRSGFGWSRDAFVSGMRGGLTGAAVNSTSTLASGMFGMLNTGAGFQKLAGFSRDNIADVGALNRFLGDIAGQGINYALTGDFVLNVLNTGIFESPGLRGGNGNAVNLGLLELHAGNGGFGMNMGTGGADASYTAVTGALRGAAAWGTNALIGAYTKRKDMDAPVMFRGLYGAGDKVQKKELWDILSGRTGLEVTKGEYEAVSRTENGRKTIYLGGFANGLSESEQLRLAAILGHEAYRDGYGVGMIDASGNLVTQESNDAERKKASIARIMMSDRINQDYAWFYASNGDFALESSFVSQYGTEKEYDDFLAALYQNDKDYFFVKMITDGDKQNGNKEYLQIPLLNARSLEEVNTANTARINEGVEKYKTILSNLDAYAGNKTLFTEKTDEEIFELIKGNSNLRKELDVHLETFYSLYNFGCKLFSAIYSAQALTGKKPDPAWVNQFAKENGYYAGEALLPNDKWAALVTRLTNGEFEVTFEKSNPSANEVMKYGNDKNAGYLLNLRTETALGYHFQMISGIEFDYAASSPLWACVKQVNSANPWKGDGSTLLSQTTIPGNRINRLDVYKVTPTKDYYNKRVIGGFRDNTLQAMFWKPPSLYK